VTERPKALDLFCKAGGASMGLHQAGFDVTGVDIEPQPHYPFRFIQADALDFPLEGYDFIWASPVCKRYTVASRRWNREHPDQIPVMRQRLQAARSLGACYCIENVPGAPINVVLVLCGQMFGLKLTRHRIFEIGGFGCPGPAHPQCAGMAMRGEVVAVHGHGCAGNKMKAGIKHVTADWKEAMGIDWMTRDELAQAVPPAYSKYIGEFAILHIRSATTETLMAGRDPA
jgi:DNA (cytosine-5)-methyltransferase 1